MADIDRIVQITISRSASVPSIASFQIPMLAAEFLISSFSGTGYGSGFTGRTGSFASLAALGAAIGTGYATHILYYMASALLKQNPAVSTFYVGRKKTGGDGTETWGTALDAMLLENNAWYTVSIHSRTLADQEAAAAWAEINARLCGLGSADTNCISGTGDIAAYLKANNYKRSFVIYNEGATGTPATDTYPELAWLGMMLPIAPGSATWAFKTPAGIIASALTPAQIATLAGILSNGVWTAGKNGNFFGNISGIGCTQFGTVGYGEFIDIIQGLDWLTALIQQYVFTTLVNNKKVPFTDQGVQMIVGQLQAALQKGVDKGFLKPLDSSSITYPASADVSSIDRASRYLPNVNFTVYTAGAIHMAQINGIVLV